MTTELKPINGSTVPDSNKPLPKNPVKGPQPATKGGVLEKSSEKVVDGRPNGSAVAVARQNKANAMAIHHQIRSKGRVK